MRARRSLRPSRNKSEMALTGKYDFRGWKRGGAAVMRAALLSSPSTAWLLKLGAVLDIILEFIVNWLANRGLVLMNVGADFVTGEFDLKAFDSELDRAIAEIEKMGGRDRLTPAEKKAIDDQVIKAARRLIVIGKPQS